MVGALLIGLVALGARADEARKFSKQLCSELMVLQNAGSQMDPAEAKWYLREAFDFVETAPIPERVDPTPGQPIYIDNQTPDATKRLEVKKRLALLDQAIQKYRYGRDYLAFSIDEFEIDPIDRSFSQSSHKTRERGFNALFGRLFNVVGGLHTLRLRSLEAFVHHLASDNRPQDLSWAYLSYPMFFPKSMGDLSTVDLRGLPRSESYEIRRWLATLRTAPGPIPSVQCDLFFHAGAQKIFVWIRRGDLLRRGKVEPFRLDHETF